MRKALVIGLGATLALILGLGLVFASDSTPTKEPEGSPFFEATLQQAVDELDGKARAPAAGLSRTVGPQQAYYTDDPQIWPECQFGYTRDVLQWPWCHFTSDPKMPDCDIPWPTKDYTWDQNLWPNCGPDITRDPTWWCDPEYTTNPEIPQCNPLYTSDPTGANPWCNDPLYTWDAVRYDCPVGEPYYTYDTAWLECNPELLTSDPYLWAECHYTSDSLRWPECVEPLPTRDYTSSPALWNGCPGPEYTADPHQWPWCNYTTDDVICEAYTQDSEQWPWCEIQNYTTEPGVSPECHYTSAPGKWPECLEPFPTKDYTFDAGLWPDQCSSLTQDPYQWPWCEWQNYTFDPGMWPWCAPNWTRDPWQQCAPGYTNSSTVWPVCSRAQHYTENPSVWQECLFYTADPGIWPVCHYTSDPKLTECDENWFPTKDYTTDTQLWPRDCGEPPGDLGDAPDRTNHTPLPGGNMTAYPGVDALYPVVFDPATGLPQGPKHWQPRADAWLGPTVTLEFDADLLPDQDTVTNIDPPSNTPDRDKGDDGVAFPVAAPHCAQTWFTYTVTIPPGSMGKDRYVNVWFDWTQDGDWLDTPYCPPPVGHTTSEWAVQNQLIPGGFPPGTYVFATPLYLAWFPQPADPEELWMRISIAEQPAPTVAGANLADGRGPAGGYEYGETEDYIFTPSCPGPTADFAWDPPTICPTTTVQFWDNSTSPYPILSWGWDFDDGGTSSVQNPSHVFGSVGSYDVSLTVSNTCASDTITKTLTVTECTTQEEEHDIYIKDSAADDGSVPSSSPWWSSPDIWVRNDVTDDCAVETSHQNPVPGTQNKICVRVRNRMTSAVEDITVNVYYASAALGLSWPGDFSYIGNLNIASLAGGAETTGSVLWNTPYTAGHFCLLARADAPKDPIGSGPDTVAPVDEVYNNNNIAQKNTNVVDYPEVTECGFTSSVVYTDVVYLDAVNTTASAIKADIEFDSADFPLGDGTLIIEPGDLWGDCTSLTHFNQVGSTLLPTAFPATMGDCDLGPSETVRMTVTIAAEIDKDFTLRVVEWVSGKEIGGIEYVRDLPNCLYLPLILKGAQP